MVRPSSRWRYSTTNGAGGRGSFARGRPGVGPLVAAGFHPAIQQDRGRPNPVARGPGGTLLLVGVALIVLLLVVVGGGRVQYPPAAPAVGGGVYAPRITSGR
jgi:hypothetical protein